MAGSAKTGYDNTWERRNKRGPRIRRQEGGEQYRRWGGSKRAQEHRPEHRHVGQRLRHVLCSFAAGSDGWYRGTLHIVCNSLGWPIFVTSL